MTLQRRAVPVALAALAATAAATFSRGVRAQNLPAKPIRLIVGYSAGGAVDIIARAIGQQLQAALGQPMIIDNKPGAGTNIAMKALIDSPADGSTLMLAANALAANVSLYQPPPFDLARDVTPVSLVGRVPVVLAVAAGSPLQTLAQLIGAAKASKNTVSYATPGNGSTPHLAVALFEHTAGIDLLHVPYKGGAQAITDLIGGHVQAVAVNALEVLPHVRSGKLKVLAVMTPQRAAIFPDVPTVAEQGFAGFEASVWYGVIGPRGMSPALVKALHAELQKALASDEVKQRLSAAGGELLPGSTEAFATLLASERTRYERLIRAARIQPD